MAGLMFFIALTAVACAQTGSDTMGASNTMGAETMETGMKSMTDDKMDKGMEKSMETMEAGAMKAGMEKPMDTMDADKTDKDMDTMK